MRTMHLAWPIPPHQPQCHQGGPPPEGPSPRVGGQGRNGPAAEGPGPGPTYEGPGTVFISLRGMAEMIHNQIKLLFRPGGLDSEAVPAVGQTVYLDLKPGVMTELVTDRTG